MSNRIVHLSSVRERPAWLNAWERRRHSKPVHWFVECFAEAFGVFLYTYAGVGATAAFVLGNILEEEGVGSLLTIGFAYAFGILMALCVASATSGGHFNPCVSVAMVVFKGFPPLKAVRYIVAQIFGGFIACLLVHAQYGDLIGLAEKAQAAAGVLDAVQFTAAGTGGILGLYVPPGTRLGPVFLNEFVTDFMLGMVIWACLDPTNMFVPPPAAPWVISFAYGVAVWSYSVPGLAANAARDVGGRLANMALYGMKASGGTYAAIAALTNIPAMLLAVLVYETMLADSDRVLSGAALEFINSHKHHARVDEGLPGHHDHRLSNGTSSNDDLKVRESRLEHA
jgi:glycerol uptake facilitator-like aquaporin